MALTPEQIANTPGMGSQGFGFSLPTFNLPSFDFSATLAAIQKDNTQLVESTKQELEERTPTAAEIANTPGMGVQGIGVTGPVVPSEAELFQAQTDAMLRADEEAFNKSRAEIEALTRQEQETIRQQTADYEASQERIRAESAAQAQQQAMEQAIIQKQLADIQAQQASAAEKFKADRDEMQRESAQKQAAARKAGRSSGARPLLGAATPDSMGQGGQSLGGTASLSGESGSLGAQQTLGVGA